MGGAGLYGLHLAKMLCNETNVYGFLRNWKGWVKYHYFNPEEPNAQQLQRDTAGEMPVIMRMLKVGEIPYFLSDEGEALYPIWPRPALWCSVRLVHAAVQHTRCCEKQPTLTAARVCGRRRRRRTRACASRTRA